MGRKQLALVVSVIILGVILASLAILIGRFPFGGKSGEPRSNLSIESDDGSAELIIPGDALPDGVDVDEISVTRVTGDQFDDDGLVVYELEPDGLEFTEPILLRVSLSSDNDTMPMVFLHTSGGIELVNGTITEVDLENKTQAVGIPLTHFSKVVIQPDHGLYQVRASAHVTYCGSPIITDSSFTLHKDSFATPSPDGSGRVIVWKVSNLFIKGSWGNGYKEKNAPQWAKKEDKGIMPTGVKGGKPGVTDVPVGRTVTYQDDSFNCIRSGLRRLVYRVEVVSDIEKIVYESEQDYMEGRSNTTATETIRKHQQEKYVAADSICMAVQGCGEEEEEPRTDPGEEGLDVKASYEWFHNDDGLYLRSEIYVDITYAVGAQGTVTLKGASIQTKQQPVYIGKEGESRVTFIVHPHGFYTVVVEIGGHTVEKEIIV